jgi:hypothetical protein
VFAVAQDVTPPPIPQLVGSVFPAAGGTDKKPIGTTVKFGLTLNREAGQSIQDVAFKIPQAVTVSARGFARCSQATARHGKCSPRSFVGAGQVGLYLGKSRRRTDYELTVYANGAHRLTFAFTGARGLVTSLASLQGHTVRLTVPALLRLTPTDTPAYLTNFELELGPAQTHGRSFAALGGCHGKPHLFGAKLTLQPPENPEITSKASAKASSPCRNP